MSTDRAAPNPADAAPIPGAPTFEYRDGTLCCEEVPIDRIYRSVGPSYVYSAQRITENARRLLKAFSRGRNLVCYAIKANSNPRLIEMLHEIGLGAQVGSGGELRVALHTGLDASQIVVGGNARTESELRQIAASGAYLVSLDSDEEILRMEEAAARLKREGRLTDPVRAAIRVNPNIDARTHPSFATGIADSKFGISPERALEWYLRPERTPHLRWTGLHLHIGSQMLDIGPLMETLRHVSDFIDHARSGGAPIDVLNLGGGFGVDYTGKGGMPVERFADAASLVSNNLGMTLVVEPGRFLVADACALVGQVLFTKRTRRSFLVTELGMTDLMRPALYNAHHEVVPVKQPPPGTSERGEIVDVVGPICENTDYLARDRRVPPMPPGSLLAVTGAGAYAVPLSSRYNGKTRLAEVLVNGSRVKLIRKAETWESILDGATDEEVSLVAGTPASTAGRVPSFVEGSGEAEEPVVVQPAPGAAPSLGAGVAAGLQRRRERSGTRKKAASKSRAKGTKRAGKRAGSKKSKR